MRIWALASCGTLLALAACSSDQSTPPTADREPPEGDSGVWLNNQPEPEVPATTSPAQPETPSPRPLARASARLSQNQQSSLGSLPSSSKSEQLRDRLNRIRAERASILSQTQALEVKSPRPEPAVELPTPASPEGTNTASHESGNDGTATPPHPWRVTVSPQRVTPLLAPDAPLLSLTPDQSGAGSEISNHQGQAVSLADVGDTSTNAQHLVTPSFSDSAPLITTTAGIETGRNHQNLSANAAGEISPSHPSQHGTLASAENTALAPAQPTSTLSRPSTAIRLPTTASTAPGQPVWGAHQGTELTAQAQLTPAEGTQQPRFSGTQLSPGTVPSPRLHGASGDNAQAGRILASLAAEQATQTRPQNSELPASFGSTAAPSGKPAEIVPSLPLHGETAQSRQTRPASSGTGQGSATASQTIQGSFPPPTELGFSETIQLSGQRLPLLRSELLQSQLHSEAGVEDDRSELALTTINGIEQAAPTLLCASQAVNERLAPPPPDAPTTVPNLAKSLTLPAPLGDQAIVFSKSKICPTGTKPLAQLIPEAAPASNPIPAGIAESPTR